ncbi:MAG TPA: tetratricopeptide repeat protein, partial [Thermodesulfovibrionales bacterium]|nr:tetratricopeptide repeat protein [Thermodesulfovibrionales bacterium]
MNKTHALTLPLVILFCALMMTSCQKGEQTARGKSEQAANPYSTDTIFDEVYKKVQQNPADAEAMYHLADLYDRNAQYPEAIETYKKVIKLKPDMGYAYFKMGTAYDRLNQPAEALDAFRAAEKYLPRHPVLYNNMGIAYGKLGKWNEEITALKTAVKLRPSYAAARYNLGVTYIRTKNTAAARKEYEALKKFDEGAAAALLKEIEKTS